MRARGHPRPSTAGTGWRHVASDMARDTTRHADRTILRSFARWERARARRVLPGPRPPAGGLRARARPARSARAPSGASQKAREGAPERTPFYHRGRPPPGRHRRCRRARRGAPERTPFYLDRLTPRVVPWCLRAFNSPPADNATFACRHAVHHVVTGIWEV